MRVVLVYLAREGEAIRVLSGKGYLRFEEDAVVEQLLPHCVAKYERLRECVASACFAKVDSDQGTWIWVGKSPSRMDIMQGPRDLSIYDMVFFGNAL